MGEWGAQGMHLSFRMFSLAVVRRTAGSAQDPDNRLMECGILDCQNKVHRSPGGADMEIVTQGCGAGGDRIIFPFRPLVWMDYVLLVQKDRGPVCSKHLRKWWTLSATVPPPPRPVTQSHIKLTGLM